MKIAMVGTGYVGLVAGVCFADAGHKVTCVDVDLNKLELLKKSVVPIFEPGLEELLAQCLLKEKISFTSDLAKTVTQNEIIFIAVGTPEKADGNADLGPTLKVVQEIAKHANGPKIVVLKSTVPIGTHKEIQKLLKENSKHSFEVVNNPEFLKEGAALDDFLRPDRIVVGCNSQKAQDVMNELYEPFVKNGHPILFMDNTSAEMTKYAANSFLSVKISFINEMAKLADKVGADINQVRKGFTSDSRINPAFFYPGIGFGGSCFPKDVQALIQTGTKYEVPMQIVQAAYNVNAEQRYHLVNVAQKHFKNLKGKKFAVWGLSFKPKTDDVREAPALYMIERLYELGATVVAYDPVATDNALKSIKCKFETAKSAIEATRGADGLFLTTEWNEFKNPDFAELKANLKTPTIFDGRNIFDPIKMKKLGFDYFCIGRQTLTKTEALDG